MDTLLEVPLQLYVALCVVLVVAIAVLVGTVLWTNLWEHRLGRNVAYSQSIRIGKIQYARFERMEPMSDEELRDWGLRLLSASPDPTRLVSYGIDPVTIVKAQHDPESLSELRRFAGVGTSNRQNQTKNLFDPKGDARLIERIQELLEGHLDDADAQP
ncbi:hypothetical protein ACKUFS_03970 [Pseudomonas cannabina]|uniref:Uncharacterized protein n=1 Tax=Pseudomonas syringae pv. maculicola str. ES4326 TaxID=629265 RepID=A0A8T8BXP7_PSEYM|nr:MULTISPECIES: hypothetical protein [Pseudomonas syringae group]QHE95753.1 hypothetical protein PMA4326_003335 [Pseudomonas syringae pv. maculicola str. ES4326]QQN23628.1 hypothetical protein JGS08_08420 [Pseudomonas cannabina pv. alisalensis]UBY96386.1 hypothetical protein LCG56_20740 [Pseudomonas cannabina pv. alisalensis]